MAAPVVETKIGTNPYVGPRSFQVGEHLYGRTREGTELLDLLIAERIVLLYSPSGAGKSSLINAVIIPGMQKEDFRVAPVLRINAEPPAELAGTTGFNRYAYSAISSLEGSLPDNVQLPPGQLAGMSLRDYLAEYRKRAGGDAPDYAPNGALMLIFDQFEEILRVNAADLDVKQAFFDQLGEVLRTDRSLWALIALREDYLAALEPYGRPIPNRLTVTYRLDFLDARSAIEAIEGPARDSGVIFEEGAAALLVDNLRKIRVQQADGTTVEQSGPYVEPVQLQVVCRRLWDKAAEKKKVTKTDVSDAGNVDDALSDYYDEHVKKAVGGSKVSERQIREWFDRKLITPTGIRGNVLMEPESSGGLPNTTIKTLQEAYLVRADQRGNAVWFELAHDRLTRPIRRSNSEWFSQNLSVFQRQADLWQLQGKPESLILKGQAFLDAEAWVKEHPEVLTQPGAEKEFFEACLQEHRTEVRERRLNTIIRWASLGLLALTAASVFFFFQARAKEGEANEKAQLAAQAQATAIIAKDDAQRSQSSAETSKNETEVRGLVAQSAYNLSVDPEVSVKLALSAFDKLNPSKSKNLEMLGLVEDALRRSLPATRIEEVLTDPSLSATPTQDRTFTSVSFDVAGTRMAAGSADGSIRIWSADVVGKPAKLIQIFEPAEGVPGVTSVAFSPDRKWLAAATGTGHVVLYDGDTYDMRQDVTLEKGPIYALAFSPDGQSLAVAGAGGFAGVMNLQNTSQVLPLKDDLEEIRDDVRAIAYSPDASWLATGDAAGAVRVWEAGTGRLLRKIPAHEGSVGGLAFSPDGKKLATSGADDRLIYLWNLAPENAVRLFTISGHRDSVNAITFNKDGSQLISASADRTVRFWDTELGRPGLVLYGHTDQVYGLALSPDGNHIATAGKDLSVRVWNIAPEGSREQYTFFTGTPIHDLAISPDGSLMAVAGQNGDVYITLAGSKTQVVMLSGHTAAVEAAGFSPDGQRIISASQDGLAKIWDAESGSNLLTLRGHVGTVWDAAFSPDGKSKQAATAGQDGAVKIWSVESGSVLQDLKAGFGPAYSLAYNDNGSLLAAGYANSQIVLWDPATGKQVGVLKGHTDAVRVVLFQPDGKVLASAGDDGSIRLWDMTSDPPGKEQPPLRKNGDAIFALAFTQDGKHLFSGGADGIGTLWDMGLRQDDFHTYGQTDRISGVAISADGESLFTGGWDGTLRMHVFSRDKLVELARNRGLTKLTEAECRQFGNVGCQVTTTVVPTATPAVVPISGNPLNVPAPSLYPAEASLDDPISAGERGQVRAQYDDDYQLNRYERPFNGDMSVYIPDVDIQSAYMSTTQKWLYFNIVLAGQSGDSIGGNYALELDMNGDGRGDYLITTQVPGADWSVQGVNIWADKNRDVGGDERYTADPPQKGDGYETHTFNEGSGDGPDLAWSRISPSEPNSVQIALLRSVVDSTSRNDNSFLWTAWASHDPFHPEWFDYNDHFTAQEVGNPILPAEQGTVMMPNLAGLDNTCRYPFGVDVKGDVFCRP